MDERGTVINIGGEEYELILTTRSQHVTVALKISGKSS